MEENCDFGESHHSCAGARHVSTHSTPYPATFRGGLTQLLELEIKKEQLMLITLFHSFLSVGIDN